MPTYTCRICLKDDALELGGSLGKDALSYRCPRCGDYLIDALAPLAIKALTETSRYQLIGVVRAASENGHPLTLLPENISDLVASAPRRRPLLEAIDRLMLLLADRTPDYWSTCAFNTDLDYPLLYARGDREMNYLLVKAAALDYFDVGDSTITLHGWQRIDSLRLVGVDSRQAFVAMWFDHSLDDAWVNGFKPAIEVHNYFRAVRVDGIEHNEKIDDRIVAEVKRSGLVVADFTGARGGVYYEAGLAQGLGIPVIWTRREGGTEAPHFDTRQYNHIMWTTPDDLRSKLSLRIEATVLPPGYLG